MRRPLNAFISYCHEDMEYKQDLLKQTFPYQSNGTLNIWHDSNLVPGAVLKPEIKSKLAAADLIITLVSSSFLGSRVCLTEELPQTIEQARTGRSWHFPVIIRPCKWKSHLGDVYCVLPLGTPLSKCTDKDEAWVFILDLLERAIDEAGKLEPAQQTSSEFQGNRSRTRLEQLGGETNTPSHHRPSLDLLAELSSISKAFDITFTESIRLIRTADPHARHLIHQDRVSRAMYLLTSFSSKVDLINDPWIKSAQRRSSSRQVTPTPCPIANESCLILPSDLGSYSQDVLMQCLDTRQILENVASTLNEIPQNLELLVGAANSLLNIIERARCAIDDVVYDLSLQDSPSHLAAMDSAA